MSKQLKLLVLELEKPLRGRMPGLTIDRSKQLRVILDSNAKIRHDSGGRFILIDMPEETEKGLLQRLPGAQLVPIDTDVQELTVDLDPAELLFLDALKIRTSKSYRDAKKARKLGETPEEKKLITGSCLKEY